MDKEIVFNSLEKALDAQHHTLYERITFLVTGSVTVSFNHALQWPHPITLAAVDRSIDLLQSFLAEAQRLKETGRPAAHDRLTAVINDLIAGRTTLSKTAGILAKPDPLLAKDRATWINEQKKWEAEQKKWMDERLKQGQNQAAEIRKLL